MNSQGNIWDLLIFTGTGEEEPFVPWTFYARFAPGDGDSDVEYKELPHHILPSRFLGTFATTKEIESAFEKATNFEK